MNKFLVRNEWIYRLLRTIVQGIIGVLIANADFLVAQLSFSPEVKALIVAIVMAILSPIMAAMGTKDMPEKGEIPYNYFEDDEFEEDIDDDYSE